MIEAHCLGPEVDPAKISPDARVSGGSYITGALTQIAAGAIVHDSRVHNGTVGEGARLEDSIFIQEGEPQSGKCDAAGRVVIRGADKPYLDKGARASGCTLVNCAIGQRTRILDTWAENCRIAEQNDIRLAKLSMVNSGRAVTISGPTEVSGASLGHHATIDQRGYFEGLFSNRFLQLRCDETTGALNVVGQIELPHVSRYGFNTVNSTNSGKLRPQLDGIVRGLGPHVGPWQDAMLNHEHVHLGPCCWVAPWTKVIGQSADAHETDDAMVNDALMSYVMPFAIAGHQGGLTQALVMPGELSIGYGPKKRQGAWAFTYAPDAVIRMVRRLWDALEPDRRHVADAIVDEALHTALAITRSMAAQRKIDLDVPSAGQRRGWPQWVARTCERLRVHLDAALWRFGDGQPLEWTEQDGRWTHPRIDRLLAVAPDALEDQVAEEALFAVPDPVPKIKMALPTGATGPRPGPPEIHGDATVAADAFIGPGCRIGAGSVVEAGARIWGSVVDAGRIGRGARIDRCIVQRSTVGNENKLRSSKLIDSTLGAGSTADSAALRQSDIAPHARIGAFADLDEVVARYRTILGGTVRRADMNSHLMLYHMCGWCEHLRSVPTTVSHEGRQVPVPAVPMLGGGCVIRGAKGRPVEIQGAFIGSNAIIEANTFVGFGCFILGTLGPDQGLLPFTVSTGNVQSHQLGGVLATLPSVVMTHFISWNFQLLGPQEGPVVAKLARQSVELSVAAIETEQRRRAEGDTFDDAGPFGRYRSLPQYSDAQLESGLSTYRKMRDNGAWDIRFDGNELRFPDERGRWLERGGSATWRASEGGADH